MGIVGVGIDTLSLDKGQSVRMPAHATLFASNIYGLENVANLDKVNKDTRTYIRQYWHYCGIKQCLLYLRTHCPTVHHTPSRSYRFPPLNFLLSTYMFAVTAYWILRDGDAH